MRIMGERAPERHRPRTAARNVQMVSTSRIQILVHPNQVVHS
jgi:hypothetical protein